MEISHDGQDDHLMPPEIIIAHNTDSSDDDEYMASAGDNSHKSALEDGDSKIGDDYLEDTHSVNLTSYLLKDGQKFDIDDVCKK